MQRNIRPVLGAKSDFVIGVGRLLCARSLAFLVVCLLGSVANSVCAETLTISCGAESTSYFECEEAAQRWASETGNTVWVTSVSAKQEEALKAYRRILRNKKNTLDLLPIEMAWVPVLNGDVLDLNKWARKSLLQGQLAQVRQAFEFKQRQVGLPWFLDINLLFFRRDLLQENARAMPQTWGELLETAEFIQRRQRGSGYPGFSGYGFQGWDEESLTRCVLEWFDSAGLDSVIDSVGRVRVGAEKYAAVLRPWNYALGRSISPRIFSSDAGELRREFQTGNLAFMRAPAHEWPMLNGVGTALEGKVDVAALPTGRGNGVHSTSLAAWALAIPRYSRHPDLAFKLAAYLVSEQEQRRRAELYSFPPTLERLYQDRALIERSPPLRVVHWSLPYLVARPIRIAGSDYPDVSKVVARRVRTGLSQHKIASQLLALKNDIQALRGELGFRDGRLPVQVIERAPVCAGPLQTDFLRACSGSL